MTESETEKEIEKIHKQIQMMRNRNSVKQKEASKCCQLVNLFLLIYLSFQLVCRPWNFEEQSLTYELILLFAKHSSISNSMILFSTKKK